MLPRAPIAALLAGSGFAALFAASFPAAAQAPGGAAAGGPPPPPVEEIEGTERPAAPDQRTGHVYVDGAVAVSGLAGSVDTGVPSRTVAGTGLSAGGTIGVGISRYVALQGFGEWTRFASPGACNTGCNGTSYALGLGLRFHVAQALAFDPWGSFGVGYRFASFREQLPQNDPPAWKNQVYQGLDVARIAFGGNFYPTPFFGFGPFIEADFGTFLKRAAPLIELAPDAPYGPTTYALFQLGVRVSFDPFRGRPSPKPTSSAHLGSGATTR